MLKKSRIPDPTVARLPVYFRSLLDLQNSNVAIVSSDEIASRTGVKASQFRKDLSYFGEFGIQGMGYPVQHLLDRIAAIMKLDIDHDAALFGVGHLGQALIRFPGFAKWRFHFRRLFDSDPEKIGKEVGGLPIEDIREIPEELMCSVGILTVPAIVAQETADSIVNAGIRAILNFTGVKLELPEDIVVKNVDLTNELAILVYHLHSRSR